MTTAFPCSCFRQTPTHPKLRNLSCCPFFVSLLLITMLVFKCSHILVLTFSFQYYQCDFHLFFDNVKLGQMESNWLTCRRSCWGGGTRWEARWWGSPVNVKYLIKSKLLFRRFSDNLEPKKIIQDIFKDCNYQRKSLHLPSSPTCCLNIWSDHKYVTRVPLFIV